MKRVLIRPGKVFSPPDDGGHSYWRAQDEALRLAKDNQKRWRQKQRGSQKNSASSPAWKRVTYSLPREQAKLKAKEFLTKYPKAAYWSEVESWRELPGDIIEFTMRRLPSAD